MKMVGKLCILRLRAPKNEGAKIFTIFYILIGLGVVGNALVEVFSILVQRYTMRMERLRAKHTGRVAKIRSRMLKKDSRNTSKKVSSSASSYDFEVASSSTVGPTPPTHKNIDFDP